MDKAIAKKVMELERLRSQASRNVDDMEKVVKDLPGLPPQVSARIERLINHLAAIEEEINDQYYEAVELTDE